MRNNTVINRLAVDVLNQRDILKAPIDVFGLIEELDIDLHFETMEDNLSGMIKIHGNGQALIVINQRHHRNRQRFTAAHELGHYFMHARQGVDTDFVDYSFRKGASYNGSSEKFKQFNRDEQSATGKREEEVEANRFAAALLMPKELIVKTAMRLNLDLTDEGDLSRLALKFKVSDMAMTHRLATIGYSPY